MVKQGEVVGKTVDISAKYKDTPPHLHVGVKKNKILQDPSNYMNFPNKQDKKGE